MAAACLPDGVFPLLFPDGAPTATHLDFQSIWPKSHEIWTKLPKSPKVNMLKFGDVSFDLGFERGRMSATGYVAKISMLRLNIGSGKLSSCMLSIGRGPKAVQGKGGGCPPLPCSHLGPRPMLSMHELSLPEPNVEPEHADLGHMTGTCPGMFGTLF